MAVENLHSIGNVKPIPIYAWIPPIYDGETKITITRNDIIGTIDDITELILEGEITDGATDTIGSFSFTIDNSSESYTGIWKGNEIIYFYSDYALTATTKRFRGRIEKVSYQNNQIKITGRSEGFRLLDITVSKSYTDTETSVIIKDLFDTYTTGFTYNNVNTSSTNVTVSWYQKTFLECIQELCTSSGYDFYIDCNMDAHYFESKSVKNSDDCFVHDQNIIDVGDFAQDYSLIKNRIIVQGADIGNIPLIYTSEDTTSQSSYGVKELVINDSNITTYEQAKERGDYELSINKDPPIIGEITGKGLATIQPGEVLRISDPSNNLAPAYYKIISYTHKFSPYFQTTVNIEKEQRNIYHIIKNTISTQSDTSEKNTSGFKYSWNFDFNSDSGSHNGTIISLGVLRATSSSGIWESDVLEIEETATGFKLEVVGQTLNGAIFQISADGGTNWHNALPISNYTFSPSGKNLKIRVTFSSADTQIDSLGLFYT